MKNQIYGDMYEYAQWKLNQSSLIMDSVDRAKALDECLNFRKSQKQCEHMIIIIKDHLIKLFNNCGFSLLFMTMLSHEKVIESNMVRIISDVG
jgi:hypothetical protein